jgi:UDP-N-acetylglucosamine 2-epimerase (non-hydrolysing)
MARRAAGRGTWVAVAGTRPNYVKLGPLVRAARARRRRLDWIDTGQHGTRAMAGAFAEHFRVGEPLARLPGRRPGAGRVAWMAAKLERELRTLAPSLVVVLGDVDSTLAGAIAAWQLDLPLVHVEAGLRSFEPAMPEERNRTRVDALSDRLYASEPSGVENLRAEGVARARIRSPGNVMADALKRARPEIERRAARLAGDLPRDGYVVATFHRQANVDDPARLGGLVRALVRCAHALPVVFPVHPRTRDALRRAGLARALRAGGVRTTAPRGYLDFLGLVRSAAAVLTDSGGLQVEAALLGVPCVTARRRTEHRLTLSHGGNRVAGMDLRALPKAMGDALAAGKPRGRTPRAWDGRAAERIVQDWCRGFARPPRLRPFPGGWLRRLRC